MVICGLSWASSVDPIALFRAIISAVPKHQVGAHYFPSVFYNLRDFFAIGLGLPLAIAFVYSILSIRPQRLHSPEHILLTAYLGTLLFTNFSGMILQEVSRVWLFLMPIPVLYASRVMDHDLEKGRQTEVLLIFGVQLSLLLFVKLRLITIVVPELLR